jgi:hypothetical protein
MAGHDGAGGMRLWEAAPRRRRMAPKPHCERSAVEAKFLGGSGWLATPFSSNVASRQPATLASAICAGQHLVGQSRAPIPPSINETFPSSISEPAVFASSVIHVGAILDCLLSRSGAAHTRNQTLFHFSLEIVTSPDNNRRVFLLAARHIGTCIRRNRDEMST